MMPLVFTLCLFSFIQTVFHQIFSWGTKLCGSSVYMSVMMAADLKYRAFSVRLLSQ